MIVLPKDFFFRLAPKLLATSYTKALPFDKERLRFPQHLCALSLRFRHTPEIAAAVGKRGLPVLEFTLLQSEKPFL
jgi:hypothetical protein